MVRRNDISILYRITGFVSKMWLVCAGLRWKTIYETPLSTKVPYVFCANHTSYLDPSALSLMKGLPVFIGKSGLGSIPCFGYIYRNLHITFDRSDVDSRKQVLVRARQVLNRNQPVVFFPEGGRTYKLLPQLSDFQPGAFRLAIATQVPVVPVTILYNWMILPKRNIKITYKPYTYRVVVHFHAPIPTDNMTKADIPALMKQVRTKIQQPLEAEFPSLFPKNPQTIA